LALSGCVTNGQFDAGKTAMLVGAIVVGGIVASQSDTVLADDNRCHWVVTSTGSTQVCDR